MTDRVRANEDEVEPPRGDELVMPSAIQMFPSCRFCHYLAPTGPSHPTAGAQDGLDALHDQSIQPSYSKLAFAKDTQWDDADHLCDRVI